jgi:hypothetical protein
MEPDYVTQLSDEVRIIGQFELADPMRLRTVK